MAFVWYLRGKLVLAGDKAWQVSYMATAIVGGSEAFIILSRVPISSPYRFLREESVGRIKGFIVRRFQKPQAQWSEGPTNKSIDIRWTWYWSWEKFRAASRLIECSTELRPSDSWRTINATKGVGEESRVFCIGKRKRSENLRQPLTAYEKTNCVFWEPSTKI